LITACGSFVSVCDDERYYNPAQVKLQIGQGLVGTAKLFSKLLWKVKEFTKSKSWIAAIPSTINEIAQQPRVRFPGQTQNIFI